MSTPPAPVTDPAGNPPGPGPDPVTPPVPPAPVSPPAGDPGTPPAGGDPALGPEGEKALVEWKRRAKDAETLTKAQATELQTYRDRDKTEAEKQADALKAATERADAATQLAVSSKVEALAASRFADPLDAVEALRLGSYLTEAGAVDADAIKAALDDLLARKPHWAAGAAAPGTPRPDPSQGPRPGGTAGGVDDQIAAAKAKGDWRTVLSLENAKLANVKN